MKGLFADLAPVDVAKVTGDQAYAGLFLKLRQPTVKEYQTFQKMCADEGIGESEFEQTPNGYRQTMKIKNMSLELQLYMYYITYAGAYVDVEKLKAGLKEKGEKSPTAIKKYVEEVQEWVGRFPSVGDPFEKFKDFVDDIGLYTFLTIYPPAFSMYYQFVGGELIFRPIQGPEAEDK